MPFHVDESFFVGLSFILFVLLVYKPIGRLISKGLDARAERIRAELDEALRLREEAQAVLASYEREQRKALENVEEVLQHAREEAERIKRRAKERAEADVEKRTQLALQKIAQAEAAVVQEIRDNTVDIVVGAARLLIMQNMNKEQAEKGVKGAITDIETKLH